MKFSILFSALFLFSATSFGASTWKYTAFPYVQKGNKIKASEPLKLRVGSNQLLPLLGRNSGTHKYWGVEQVYATRNLKKKVFVKYNVQLSSMNPIGSWLKVKNGQLLHLKKDGAIVAYYAQGFNNVELFDIQKQFTDKRVSILEILNPIACAHAEVTSSEEVSPSSSPATPTPDRSFLERAGNVIACTGKQTMDAAWAAGENLVKNASFENAAKAAQDIGSAALDAIPTWEETQGAFMNAGQFVGQTFSDPGAAWNNVTNKFDETTKLVAQIYQQMTEAVANFASLDSEVQDRIICDAVTKLAAEGVLGVALAATGGGAAMAAAKLTAAVLRYASRIKPLMHALNYLSKATHLGKEEKMLMTDRMLKGEMSEVELKALQQKASQHSLSSENERIRHLSEGDKAQMLQEASVLDDSTRLSTASSVLGHELTDAQKQALISAHNVASDKGFGEYSVSELRQKKEILLRAGYSADEAELLMRRGLAGQFGPSGVVSSGPKPVNVARPIDSPSTNTVAMSSSMNSASAKGMTALRAGDIAAAKPHLTQASQTALNIAKQTVDTRPEIAAANLRRSISLPVVNNGNLTPQIELARRLNIYGDITPDRFTEIYDRSKNGNLFTISNFGNVENYQTVVTRFNNLTIMKSLAEDRSLPGGPSLTQINEQYNMYRSLMWRYEQQIKP